MPDADTCNRCEQRPAVADWSVCWDCFITDTDAIQTNAPEVDDG